MLSFPVYPRVRPAIQQPLLGFWPGALHHMHLSDLAQPFGGTAGAESHTGTAPKSFGIPQAFQLSASAAEMPPAGCLLAFLATLNEMLPGTHVIQEGKRLGDKASVRNLLRPLPLLLDHVVFAFDTACQSWAGKNPSCFSTELFYLLYPVEKKVNSKCFKGSCFSDLWALHFCHF